MSALIPLALLLIAADPPAPGGLTPAEARDRMVVPPGFRVEVFASEPDVRQPVAACFDERGRMWVIEYLQYPNPAGLVPVKVDQFLRTEYDRTPEPPPKGPRGADRIKILEDTDGDGKADKYTTFVEGLNLASGIAVGHGGVWVGQAPYLLFYPDKDRDDKPDGDPVVKLAGFGLQDAHATLNSFTWGPDGWLYGAQGSTVTAKIRGVEFQQGIWRFHPKAEEFELFAEGGGNTWGVDFDRGGNLFGSSNGGFVAFHMVRGGNYWKGFAKHGPLHNPRTYGYFDAIAYSGPKPGGHVTPGGILYKGEQFPKEYRGAFLGANLLSNAAYWYRLAPKGSTFAMSSGGTLLDARDPWFRPIDLLTGPDGSVYVVDWYDKRASHLDPRDTWDRSNGRIYKVSYGKPAKLPSFDLAKLSASELAAMREEANDWWFETALRLLHERRDLREAPGLLKAVLTERKDEAKALRALFALYACEEPAWDATEKLLGHPLPGVRRWVWRCLGDRADIPPGAVKVFGEGPDAHPIDVLKLFAFKEVDPSVRGEIASACGRWPAARAADYLFAIALPDHTSGDPHMEPPEQVIRPGDATNDPHLPLRMWWAVERALRSDPAAVVATLTQPLRGGRPAVLRREIDPRMARALAEDGTPWRLDLCATILMAAESAEDRRLVLEGMARGLEGHAVREVPARLREAIAKASEDRPQSLALLKTSIRLGSEEAHAQAVRLLDRPKAELAGPDRLGLIALIGSVPHAEGKKALLNELAGESDDATLAAVFAALGRLGGDDVADRILSRYALLGPSGRSRALDALASRKEWAVKLVASLGPKGIPASDLKPGQAARIAQWNDAAMTDRLEAAWGRLPNRNTAAKARRIAEVRGVLPEGDKGDPARGRAVFQANCMACHRLFGEGERIGPELTGSERGDLEFLLTSLVDPSAVIRKEYAGQTLALKDGRVLNGLIVEEDGGTLTLFDSQKLKATIPKSEIEDRKAADLSIMPEGMLDALSEAQIRDLFRYLQSGGPG